MTEPAGATFAAEGCSSVLGITSFNHVTKEVCDLEASRRFYCDVLGFQQVRRPAFKIDGIWLHGHNLGLHLLCPTDNHKRRTKRTQQKKEYHQSSVPVCDHMAFTVLNMEQVESFLQSKKMEYTKVDNRELTGSVQIFIMDPDGNVIELSNCAPPVNEVRCANANALPPDSEPKLAN